MERAKTDLREAMECLLGIREAVGSIGLDRGGVAAGVIGPIIIITLGVVGGWMGD